MLAEEFLTEMRGRRPSPRSVPLRSGEPSDCRTIVEPQSESMTLVGSIGDETTTLDRDVDGVPRTTFETPQPPSWQLDLSETADGSVAGPGWIVRCEICGERVPFNEDAESHRSRCRDRNPEYQFPLDHPCPLCKSRTWWHQGGHSWCKSCLYGVTRFS